MQENGKKFNLGDIFLGYWNRNKKDEQRKLYKGANLHILKETACPNYNKICLYALYNLYTLYIH